MARRRANNEGSIFFSDSEKCWIAEVVLPDGRKKRKRSKKQQVVREWLLKQRDAIRDNLLIDNERLTVSEFIARYMDSVAAHNLRPKTVEAYSSLIRIHINPTIGSIRLSQLRPDHLQNLYSEKRKAGLSNRTVQFIHSIIHKVLDQALKWGLVLRNVADLVEKPTVKRKAPTIWTNEQVSIFLRAVKDHRFYPIYVLALAGGFREGEVLGIQFSDIDWDNGIINVTHAVQYLIGKGVVLTEPKTEKGKRPVPLPEYALRVLKEHCDSQNRNQGFIFVTGNITPFSPRNLVRHFKQVIEDTELPEIRFHDLRHYHASYLLSQGINPKIVQERLGHSTILLTLDTYSHTTPSLQKEAALKANAMFEQ
jgi:integrase